MIVMPGRAVTRWLTVRRTTCRVCVRVCVCVCPAGVIAAAFPTERGTCTAGGATSFGTASTGSLGTGTASSGRAATEAGGSTIDRIVAVNRLP